MKLNHSFKILLPVLIFSASCAKLDYNRKAKLVWNENFNQKTSFDNTRWSKIPRGGSDWNKHMSDFDSLYVMRNGKMVLRGIKNYHPATDTARFITGGIYTKDKMSFGFGRLEIKARLNGAKGAWPAFWMLAANAKWPEGGEIDIMERLNYDSIAYQTVHSDYTLKLNIKNNPLSHITGKINPGEFNTYAVEKYPDSLVFFINGKKTLSYPRIQTDKAGQFPFSGQKHYLLVDMQLGGSWVGAVDMKDLPVEMEIDHVRFYEFKK